MRSYEIFQGLAPELASEIIGFIRQDQRDVYRTTLASLAVQRKLRPVFVQRKSGAQQAVWLHNTLKLRPSESIGEHLIQVWLLKEHADLLVLFLDTLGVAHDGEGAVEDLPDEIDESKLEEAVNAILHKFPVPVVTIYLYVFQLQRPGGWDEMARLLEQRKDDLRLKGEMVPLPGDPPAPSSTPAKKEEVKDETPPEAEATSDEAEEKAPAKKKKAAKKKAAKKKAAAKKKSAE